MKCIRCERSGMGILHPAVILKDKNRICYSCFRELGFNPIKDNIDAQLMYSWDDIMYGREEMENRKVAALIQRTNEHGAEKYGMSPTHYGQLEAAGSTDNEKKIFAAICSVLQDEGYDTKPLKVELGDGGSLLIKIDDVVMLRYKSEPNVKWIVLPNESEEKIRIGGSGRINSMAPRIAAAYDSALDKARL